MQSEEIDDCSVKAATPAVNESLEKEPFIDDFKPSDLGIDFEADLDKMLPDSVTSSDTEDGEPPPLPLPLPPPQMTPQLLKSLHEQNSNESIRTWLQRITQMQNEIQKKLQVGDVGIKPPAPVTQQPAAPPQHRVVKYQDLPYMGEMTLDNSKPRRGRKPKKADICHLIYKNYGTIFPGTPNAKTITENNSVNLPRGGKATENKIVAESPASVEHSLRTNVQNRIISSLLEKRLTQETKRQQNSQHEPLNLCMRDLDNLKIRRKSDLFDIKSEPHSDDDVEFVHETTPSPSTNKDFKFPAAAQQGENGSYVYWPNAGVFIHPMALQQQLLYYQKMNNNVKRPTPESTPELPELRKLVPKKSSKKSENTSEDEAMSSDGKSKRNAASSSHSDKIPAKRKRSAIFIPPIPPENQNNPATEVSICKFKFTGGAKPSLQEKKMLSVDSGGNFRYYSGTGDKSMRGYEFFPRETLQQQVNNTQGSSTGAFLQASGEKIYPGSPIDFTSKVNEFMLTPEISNHPTTSVADTAVMRSKKRKSRKSLQREKLEQTFKEKGFLIQTQQLESAEGATYCKFRQLRKFTRYLFRSWKDYLPGNVGENADKVEIDEIADQDFESNLSSPGVEGDTSPPP